MHLGRAAELSEYVFARVRLFRGDRVEVYAGGPLVFDVQPRKHLVRLELWFEPQIQAGRLLLVETSPD